VNPPIPSPQIARPYPGAISQEVKAAGNQARPHKALRGAIARKPLFYKGVGHVDNVDNVFLVDILQVWGAGSVGHVDNVVLGGSVGHVDNLFFGCPHDPQSEGFFPPTESVGEKSVGHVDNVDTPF